MRSSISQYTENLLFLGEDLWNAFCFAAAKRKCKVTAHKYRNHCMNTAFQEGKRILTWDGSWLRNQNSLSSNVSATNSCSSIYLGFFFPQFNTVCPALRYIYTGNYGLQMSWIIISACLRQEVQSELQEEAFRDLNVFRKLSHINWM